LGVLKPFVVLQVDRDTGRPPSVTSDGGEKTSGLSPLPDSRPGVVPVKSSSLPFQRSSRINALEQGLPALEVCGLNVLVQDLLEQMMHWYFVLLASFFVESQFPPRAVMIVIIHLSPRPKQFLK
jgi:hypothetical protein